MGGALDPTVAAGRNLVRRVLSDLAPGARVRVGVSGGADSLALAAVTAFVARERGWNLDAVIVDHQLQDGSADVARRAQAQLEGLGVNAQVVSVHVGTVGGPEGAARAARYDALLSGGADAVLVAHTLDDQAETVLLGLGRGSGARSLAGMAEADGRLRRPFLSLRRADTERICAASGLTWWTDPHNSDPAFRRSRLRTEVLPLLEHVLGGGVAHALARTATQLQRDHRYLDQMADAVQNPDSVDALASLDPAIRSRVLRRRAVEQGADASELAFRHVEQVDRLITAWRGQQWVELPGSVRVARQGGWLVWSRGTVKE
jgi:tRNA(Ile)-lysidine synthase